MYFQLRGKLPKQTKTLIGIAGTVIMLVVWTAITEGGFIPQSILPSPLKVVTSFGALHYNDALVRNAAFSLYLNFLGLLEAIALAVPLGFIIGLFPVFRAMSEGYITAGRFIPLTAVVGVFIAWFGIETNMKVQFLAFSIFLFLLPVVMQKVDEIEEVYVQAVTTLGASQWQTIKLVFIPTVISRVFDSIRVLAALSWTYIVVAEMVNANGGGVGALCYISARQSRIDKVFAILLTIVLIGFIQDRILLYLDRMLFPYKYLKK
jgi:NitT/TauT family transport system permease protein